MLVSITHSGLFTFLMNRFTWVSCKHSLINNSSHFVACSLLLFTRNIHYKFKENKKIEFNIWNIIFWHSLILSLFFYYCSFWFYISKLYIYFSGFTLTLQFKYHNKNKVIRLFIVILAILIFMYEILLSTSTYLTNLVALVFCTLYYILLYSN